MDAGQSAVVAAGGSGGRGNKRFASPARQAPHFAELGLPGEEGWLELALKLLADVGLVGLPNAGKSSLLARLTRATPKVAAYPFTTLEPALGVLEGEDRQLVLADIPGLIEGASRGAGLGDEFLAHVERTRLLVHVLDLAPDPSTIDAVGGDAGPADARALLANYGLVERELTLHDPRLARLPRVLALSKADLVPSERADELRVELSRHLDREVPVILTSSATGVGVARLAAELLAKTPATAAAAAGDTESASVEQPGTRGGPAEEEVLAEHWVFHPGTRTGYDVQQVGPGLFAVHGAGVERMIDRFDLENDEAVAYVEARLRRLGVLGALRSKGFHPGDEVRIGSQAVPIFSSVPVEFR